MKPLFFLFFIFSTFAFSYEKAKLCPALQACFQETLEECSKEDLKPYKKITYDEEFCAPFQEIKKRGLSVKSDIGKEVYSKLSGEYRVFYKAEGTLPATKSMMSFLFDYMPFTAELINAYQDANYELHYTNRNHTAFSGSNGRSLSGDFIWALQDSLGQKKCLRNVFLGYGRAKVLKWSLKGIAIAFLDMDVKDKNTIYYKLTAIVFPANSILNSIMQMNLFKAVVSDKIDNIVQDVVNSAKSFAEGEKDPILKSEVFKTGKYKQELKLFEEVVGGRSWELGDALKNKGIENGK